MKKVNLRREARGRDCQIRIPEICNGNPETTVLCHKGGAGLGMKGPDQIAAWGCSSCHDAVDGRLRSGITANYDYRLYFYDGIFRTQEILISEGKM